uniref:Major facilitator superfamily associated domain-containing protein n=1 Tax=Tetranychus urticae TaxID=32264 RepID=T1KQC6_TETUR
MIFIKKSGLEASQYICVFELTRKAFSTLMATYAGGKILSMEPWIKGQNKNYIGVFLVALASLVSGLIYACLMTLEFTPSTEPDKDKLSFFQVLKDVFQIGRFKQLVKLFTKQRPNNGRLRLILLITSGAVCLAAILGEDGIAYQFAQKVYGLTQDQYTSLYSILCIAPAIVTSIGPPIGRSYFGFSDSIIAILGCLILSVRGYIAGFLIGAFCRIATAAIRSLVSGMVDSAESAQVFTLATAFENYISLCSLHSTRITIFHQNSNYHSTLNYLRTKQTFNVLGSIGYNNIHKLLTRSIIKPALKIKLEEALFMMESYPMGFRCFHFFRFNSSSLLLTLLELGAHMLLSVMAVHIDPY